MVLDSEAAVILDDKVLDAQVGEQGNVEFLSPPSSADHHGHPPAALTFSGGR